MQKKIKSAFNEKYFQHKGIKEYNTKENREICRLTD